MSLRWVEDTQEAFPNDIKSLERRLRRNKFLGQGTAAVIVEPMGTESGTRPVDSEHNQQIRELCDRYGALLIFDEVVTAFRIGISGAQGYFGVKPDLTVFGKVVAGGYPAAGGLGGSRDLMEYLAASFTPGFFVAGMSIRENLYLGTFMNIFVVLAFLTLLAVFVLRESTFMETESGHKDS